MNKNTPVPVLQNGPLIAFIVAVFNGADTLQRCIDSVAEQTYRYKQLIVIDGGSTDGTVDVLKANSEKISYWESKPDRGVAHAWNKGLRHTKGDWMVFLGADDYLTQPTILTEMVPYLQANSDEYLVFGHVVLSGGEWEGTIMGFSRKWKKFRRRMTLPHAATFYSRKLFEEVGNFDESYHIGLEYDLLLRLKEERFSPVFVDKVVTVMSAEGISMRNREESLAEARKAQLKHRVAPALLVNLWYAYFRVRVFQQKLLSHWRRR